MAAKKNASRKPGPGRHPQIAYAHVVVVLHSMKDGTLTPEAQTVVFRLPDKHRVSDVSLSVRSVSTLIPKD